jgi:hypothetical protein
MGESVDVVETPRESVAREIFDLLGDSPRACALGWTVSLQRGAVRITTEEGRAVIITFEEVKDD